MPTARLTAKSESTVANIMSAAVGLFVARNYAEVSMNQIAEAGNLTKGALYHHFSSKEELYLAMMHAELTEKKSLFTRVVDNGTTCRDRLSRLTRSFFALPHDKREIMRLVRRDINIVTEPARSELVRAYQDALPRIVGSVIADGIRDGELSPGDPRLLSWNFVALVEVTLNEHADAVFEDPERKLEFVINQFFCGAAARNHGAIA